MPRRSRSAGRRVWCAGGWQEAAVWDRETLAPGDALDGPAIIVEANATTVLEPGWRAETTRHRHLVLSRVTPRATAVAVGTAVDPVMLEVFNNLFMSIAEQMGAALANTAQSVNIKERLDFSCAVFDPRRRPGGQCAASAGASGLDGREHRDGDPRAAGNDAAGRRLRPQRPLQRRHPPSRHHRDHPGVRRRGSSGGAAGDEILFFVGSRGHHADIGGITPGSMPPDSRSIDEEGILIDNVVLVEQGRFCEPEMRALLASGRYPARNLEQNLADLRAQVAANEKGAHELRRMVAHFGLMSSTPTCATSRTTPRSRCAGSSTCSRTAASPTRWTRGRACSVAIRIDAASRSATIDFTGTSAQQPSNFNAPPAVAKAAVLYVFRTLIEDDIPLNAGCLKPLRIVIPEGSMLSPRHPAAVVAGNVETSQVITDALYGALGVMAAAQGTMNNFTFGNDRHQYYETICGGSGAGPDFDGTDAVHTHMTNTRLTDPEVLEWRFPVLLRDFHIRRGSGGGGRHRGGCGVVRRIEFREPMTAAILSGHRRVPPFGLEGGAPGAVGRNWLQRADGRIMPLSGTDQAEMAPGDVFVIETPGGGGFGGG